MADADAAILNTLYELEPAALEQMRAMIPPSASIHTIGPLALLTEEILPPCSAFETSLLHNTFVVSIGKVFLVSALQFDTIYTI
jgi:hypothetical protein